MIEVSMVVDNFDVSKQIVDIWKQLKTLVISIVL